MRQTSVRSDRVAELLDALVRRTGEARVEAVERALEVRLRQLEVEDRASATIAWLERDVWSSLSDGARGRAPTREEQEALLGF
jgi:antitoxin VapB